MIERYYCRCHSWEDLQTVLERGAEYTRVYWLAGGTDLLVQQRKPFSESPGLGIGGPVLLADISGLPREGEPVRVKNDWVEIDARITHSQLLAHPFLQVAFPLLPQAARLVGGKQIRNRGTLGGNLANMAACGNLLPVLLHYGAVLLLVDEVGGQGTPRLRRQSLQNYWQARLEQPEQTPLILRVALPCRAQAAVPAGTCRLAEEPRVYEQFYKLGKRNAAALSLVNLAAACTLSPGQAPHFHFTVGAVTSLPRQFDFCPTLHKTSGCFEAPARECSEVMAAELEAEFGPRPSRVWKKEVLAGYIQEFFYTLFQEADDGILEGCAAD